MRIHLVPNSHIDPAWLWDKHEGIDEVLNTFRSACDRLDEFPELTFSASSLQFYEWTLKFDAALFRRIRALIDEGRWEVCGGWWVEADTNLPLESSFLKHAELSAKFIREHLGGLEIATAFLPDSFGHPATLPKILARCGFKHFIFCRPDAREKPDLPANLFRWEHDGHSVLAYRLKHHYTQGSSPAPGMIRAHLDDEEYRRRPVNCYFFGVGDHGGGPTIKEIELFRQIIAEHPPGDMGFSTCARFFAEAARSSDIPLYAGDLHMHAIGCYSVLGDVKNAVRGCELALEHAGRALTMCGGDTAVLEPAWKTTLFNQFHDILPGSCSPAAAENARAELGGVRAACRDAAYAALKSVSRRTPPRCREGEFRIFNTLPHPVTAPLAVESMVYYRQDAAFRAADGRPIEIQEALPSVRAGNRKWEFVDTIPARGFAAYHFDGATTVTRPDRGEVHFRPCDTAAADAFLQPLRATIRWLVLADDSDTWGHGRSRYDDVAGEFELQSSGIMRGPVADKLAQRWTCGCSAIDVVYTRYRALPGIHAAVRVLWNERRRLLKLEITPENGRGPSLTMQCAGGPVERRADGRELPMHRWVRVPAGESGLAVVQKGAFACDCLDGRLRLTLIRSSLYGFEDGREVLEPDPQHDTDFGLREFALRLLPDAPADTAALDRLADVLNEPFIVIRES
jgi:alpha-mannosidase